MRPLTSLDAARARALEGLLFDLDDTVLSHGLLTREAFGAIYDLHDAGLRLVAVTGRPSGWG
jgi:hydroxymethylpyrimidine pyrophosphatase-like HAD family hydrolase